MHSRSSGCSRRCSALARRAAIRRMAAARARATRSRRSARRPSIPSPRWSPSSSSPTIPTRKRAGDRIDRHRRGDEAVLRRHRRGASRHRGRLAPDEARANIDDLRGATASGAILEIQVGIDGIAFAEAKQRPEDGADPGRPLPRARRDARAASPTPRETWRDVNPALPAIADPGLRPARDQRHARRARRADPDQGLRGERSRAPRRCKDAIPTRTRRCCTRVREDGAYVDAGENDNLIVQKLAANPNAIGMFGYSYLEENAGRGARRADRRRRADLCDDRRRPLSGLAAAVPLRQEGASARGAGAARRSSSSMPTTVGPDGPLVRRGLIAAPDRGPRAMRRRSSRRETPLDPADAAVMPRLALLFLVAGLGADRLAVGARARARRSGAAARARFSSLPAHHGWYVALWTLAAAAAVPRGLVARSRPRWSPTRCSRTPPRRSCRRRGSSARRSCPRRAASPQGAAYGAFHPLARTLAPAYAAAQARYDWIATRASRCCSPSPAAPSPSPASAPASRARTQVERVVMAAAARRVADRDPDHGRHRRVAAVRERRASSAWCRSPTSCSARTGARR